MSATNTVGAALAGTATGATMVCAVGAAAVAAMRTAQLEITVRCLAHACPPGHGSTEVPITLLDVKERVVGVSTIDLTKKNDGRVHFAVPEMPLTLSLLKLAQGEKVDVQVGKGPGKFNADQHRTRFPSQEGREKVAFVEAATGFNDRLLAVLRATLSSTAATQGAIASALHRAKQFRAMRFVRCSTGGTAQGAKLATTVTTFLNAVAVMPKVPDRKSVV